MPLHSTLYHDPAIECCICFESPEEIRRTAKNGGKDGTQMLYKCDRKRCDMVYCMTCIVRIGKNFVERHQAIKCVTCFKPLDQTALRKAALEWDPSDAIPPNDEEYLARKRPPVLNVITYLQKVSKARYPFGDYYGYEAWLVQSHPLGDGSDEVALYRSWARQDWINFWRFYFGTATVFAGILYDPIHSVSPSCPCDCWDYVTQARRLKLRLRPSDIDNFNHGEIGTYKPLKYDRDTLQLTIVEGTVTLVPEGQEGDEIPAEWPTDALQKWTDKLRSLKINEQAGTSITAGTTRQKNYHVPPSVNILFQPQQATSSTGQRSNSSSTVLRGEHMRHISV